MITQNEEVKIDMQDNAKKPFEKIQETKALLEILAQGESQIAEGKFQPVEEVIANLRNRNKKR